MMKCYQLQTKDDHIIITQKFQKHEKIELQQQQKYFSPHFHPLICFHPVLIKLQF